MEQSTLSYSPPLETPCSNEKIWPSVLCVDDDPEISLAIALRLRDYEVDVLRAFYGSQGMWLAATEKPDLIITDVGMPSGTGDFVVECLKRNAQTEDIPIIVLTGHTDHRLRQQMLRLGVDEFFGKPVDGCDLLSAIESFIPLRERRDEMV